MNKGKRIGIILGAIFGLIMHAGAAEYFLDAAAAGANNGTSWENAWRNTTDINWSAIGSGDRLWIRGGNYSQFKIVSKRGLTIQISPDAVEQAVFSSTVASELYDVDDTLIDGLLNGQPMFRLTGSPEVYTAAGTVFRLRHCQNTTLRGMEVERSALYQLDEAPVHGIALNNSSAPANDFIIIEHCYLHHLTADGININTAGAATGYDHFIVRHCRIHNVMDDGVQASGSFTMHDCHVNRAGEVPKFGGHADGLQTAIGAQYIRVFNNFFTDFGQNIFIEYASGYVQLFNNVMVGVLTSSSERGMNVSVQTNFVAEYVLANNTFYNFLTFNAIHGGGTLERMIPPENRYIGNNLFINCKYLIMSAPELLDSSNIYWDTADVQYYTTDGASCSVPLERRPGASVYADPLVADLARLDFHLLSDSPALGAGRNFSQFFSTDKDGNLRVPPWNIGALGLFPGGVAPAAAPKNVRAFRPR